MALGKLRGLARVALHHPITREHRLESFSRWARFQIASRALRGPVIAPFVSGTQLLIPPQMAGTRDHAYFGLAEFEDMGFLLHYLRPEDLLGDVGANIGAYTVLAAGACSASVVALEPVPAAFRALLQNIALNGVVDQVTALPLGAGAEAGELCFSTDRGTMNRVVAAGEGIRVPVRPLDQVFADRPPTVLKIDVEGFEAPVLQGARLLLGDPALAALLIETNEAATQYGASRDALHRQIRDAGFAAYTYCPRSRRLEPRPGIGAHNTLYLRDAAAAAARVRQARPFRVFGRDF